jgi:LysM domain
MAKDRDRDVLVTSVSPRGGGGVGDGWIQIQTKEWTLECLLGDDVPQYGDIDSGYAAVAAPRARGYTRWNGDLPLTATLPLILDGWAASVGVERDRDRLIKLAHAKDDDERPEDFVMRGPVPLAGERVVCTGLAWGVSLRGHNGQLQRQALTFSIMQFMPPDRLKVKKRGRGNQPSRYTVKEGDTLKRIAAKLKPKASGAEISDYAQKIGKLNDIRDVNKKLKKGTELRLP